MPRPSHNEASDISHKSQVEKELLLFHLLFGPALLFFLPLSFVVFFLVMLDVDVLGRS